MNGPEEGESENLLTPRQLNSAKIVKPSVQKPRLPPPPPPGAKKKEAASPEFDDGETSVEVG